MSESEVKDQLIVLLAGRAAEQIIYAETSVGAENDLERATTLARRMISHWGMSHKLGPVSFKLSDSDPFLGREMHQQRQFSEKTQEIIDGEIGETLRIADKAALELLQKHRDALEQLKDALVSREELDEKEIRELIGPSVHRPEVSLEETQLSDSTASVVSDQ